MGRFFVQKAGQNILKTEERSHKAEKLMDMRAFFSKLMESCRQKSPRELIDKADRLMVEAGALVENYNDHKVLVNGGKTEGEKWVGTRPNKLMLARQEYLHAARLYRKAASRAGSAKKNASPGAEMDKHKADEDEATAKAGTCDEKLKEIYRELGMVEF